MKKRLSIPLLICTALVVYALVAEPPRIIQDPQPPVTQTRVPESYAHEVRVLDYDESGKLLDQTEALEMRRFADEEATELDVLQNTHISEKGPWLAQAQRGYLNERIERLNLEGDVRLRYEVEGVAFASESMTLNLRERTARSTAPVRAWRGPDETRADGLFVNLDRQIATLNGTVKTVYQPSGDEFNR